MQSIQYEIYARILDISVQRESSTSADEVASIPASLPKSELVGIREWQYDANDDDDDDDDTELKNNTLLKNM